MTAFLKKIAGKDGSPFSQSRLLRSMSLPEASILCSCMSPLKKGLTPRRQVAKKTDLMKKPFAALATLREISGFLQRSHA
jgi:hypothetical protein